jgi:hypothetical protein
MAADRIVRENSGFCMVFPIHLHCERDGEGFHRASVARRVFAFSAASVGDAGIARRLTCPRFDRWLLLTPSKMQNANHFNDGPLACDLLTHNCNKNETL